MSQSGDARDDFADGKFIEQWPKTRETFSSSPLDLREEICATSFSRWSTGCQHSRNISIRGNLIIQRRTKNCFRSYGFRTSTTVSSHLHRPERPRWRKPDIHEINLSLCLQLSSFYLAKRVAAIDFLQTCSQFQCFAYGMRNRSPRTLDREGNNFLCGASDAKLRSRVSSRDEHLTSLAGFWWWRENREHNS